MSPIGSPRKDQQKWNRRAQAILGAIVAMQRRDPTRHEFTAAEVADVVNAVAWTERQRSELTMWIQRAGRQEFGEFQTPPRTIASGVHGALAVRYIGGVFVVEDKP